MKKVKIQNPEEKNNRELRYLLFFLTISLLFLIVLFWYYRPLNQDFLNIRFFVGENPGFELNTSLLTFGRIPPGSNSMREIRVYNEFKFPVRLETFVSPNLKDFVKVSPVFYIPSKNSTKISILVDVPHSAEFGNYSGYLSLRMRRK